MELKDVFKFYSDNIGLLFTPNMFEKIADHSSYLQGLSFTNRGLALLQCYNAVFLRPRSYWEGLNYNIIDANSIYIMSHIPYSTISINDSDSTVDLIKADLTSNELDLAIDLGMVFEELEDMPLVIIELYNMDSVDTLETDSNNLIMQDIKQVDDRRVLDIKALEQLLNILGVEVAYSDTVCNFDAESNTVYLIEGENDSNLSISLYAIVKILAAVINDLYLDNGININDDLSKIGYLYIRHVGDTFFGFELFSSFTEELIDDGALEGVYTSVKSDNKFLADSFIDVIELLFNRYISNIYDNDAIFEYDFMYPDSLTFKSLAEAFYQILITKQSILVDDGGDS